MKNNDLHKIDLALKKGELAILPTETVYGLAAYAHNFQAIEHVYNVKGRGFDKPLALCIRDIDDAQHVAVFSDLAKDIANRFWPGPITLVLPAKDKSLHNQIYGKDKNGEPTVALRCPDIVWRDQLSSFPLVLTSANRSGRPASKTAAEALTALSPEVRLVLDTGPAKSGQASMIIAVDGQSARILRYGESKPEDFAPFQIDWLS